MAFAYGNSNGVMNGTAQVDIVASPAAATQRGIRNILFHNRDTVAHTITLKYHDGGSLRTIDSQSITPGASWLFGAFLVLDTTSKKIVAVMAASHTTTAPDFVANWSDNN